MKNIKKYKLINWSLIGLILLLAIETLIGIMGRAALLENNFESAKRWLSFPLLGGDKEMLGLVYYKQENYEEAFAYYKDLNDFRGMGWAYYGMGEYADAEEYFKRVDDSVGLGQVALAKGNYAKGRELFRQTDEKSGLGLTYLADGDYPGAAQAFQEAEDPLGLGLTYFAKGDFDNAKIILSSSNNVRINAIHALIDDEPEKAANQFRDIGDQNLYAAALTSFGDYEQALNVYLDNNQTLAAAEILLAMGRYSEALDLFRPLDDKSGEADVFLALGIPQKAHTLYHEAGQYHKAYLALIHDRQVENALRYAQSIYRENSERVESLLWAAEASRILGDYGKTSLFLKEFQEKSHTPALGKLLEARLALAKGEPENIPSIMQTVIDTSGSGSLAQALLLSGKLWGWSLSKPQKITLTPIQPSQRIAWVPMAIGLLFGCGILAYGIIHLQHRRHLTQLEMDSLQIQVRPQTTQSLKDIYKTRTPANTAVATKVEPPKKTQTSPAPPLEKPATPVIEPSPAAKSETIIQSSGAIVLCEALKRLDVTATVAELIEASGEESSKLTVYGIYLAARAKGIQVQGIKVDFSYLDENRDGCHLVFFSDENFALLERIEADQVILVTPAGEQEALALPVFKSRWNSYVVTLTKS